MRTNDQRSERGGCGGRVPPEAHPHRPPNGPRSDEQRHYWREIVAASAMMLAVSLWRSIAIARYGECFGWDTVLAPLAVAIALVVAMREIAPQMRLSLGVRRGAASRGGRP